MRATRRRSRRGYAANGADEIVFLDISAAPEARGTLLDVVERTAKRVFVPLTVGGGVRRPDEMRDVLRAGADKVAVNTAAIRDPSTARPLRAAIRPPVRGHLGRCTRGARPARVAGRCRPGRPGGDGAGRHRVDAARGRAGGWRGAADLAIRGSACAWLQSSLLGQQHLAGTERHGSPDPLDRVQPGRLPPAAGPRPPTRGSRPGTGARASTEMTTHWRPNRRAQRPSRSRVRGWRPC